MRFRQPPARVCPDHRLLRPMGVRAFVSDGLCGIRGRVCGSWRALASMRGGVWIFPSPSTSSPPSAGSRRPGSMPPGRPKPSRKGCVMPPSPTATSSPRKATSRRVKGASTVHCGFKARASSPSMADSSPSPSYSACFELHLAGITAPAPPQWHSVSGSNASIRPCGAVRVHKESTGCAAHHQAGSPVSGLTECHCPPPPETDTMQTPPALPAAEALARDRHPAPAM